MVLLWLGYPRYNGIRCKNSKAQKRTEKEVKCVGKMKKLVMNDSTALFLYAMEFYGVREKIGDEHNPVILNWFHQIGHQWVTTDETSWCSAYLNYICKEMGMEYSGELTARSWLKVGTDVPLRDIRRGHVVVFWRESPLSWKGHVGLAVARDLHHVYTLGGNQDNMVCIKPYRTDRLLGVRKLKRTTFT